MTRSEMREHLEKKLSNHRFEHSLGVEYTAACLAMVHGMDVERAAIAGLLHDCAKYMDKEEKLKVCKKYQLSVSDVEKKNTELLHAKVGCVVARKKYEIQDEEILSAIMYHTTGKPEMTDLEKIVFIADYIEPNRKKLQDMEQIRKEAFQNLDECIVHILKNTINYLKKNEMIVDDMSLKTYDYYTAQ